MGPGRSPVGDLGDEVPQKLKQFCKYNVKNLCKIELISDMLQLYILLSHLKWLWRGTPKSPFQLAHPALKLSVFENANLNRGLLVKYKKGKGSGVPQKLEQFCKYNIKMYL